MKTKGTVVAAMSGGVDSAVAAALLKQQGWEVIGITLQIWQERDDQSQKGGCCSLGAVEDARRAANRVGIPHYVLNFKDTFGRQVIDKFVSEYARGRTPNPCVECNRSVKFDELLKQARNLGADYLATGHYARVSYDEDTSRWQLRTALDAKKDQSYFLYTLSQEQLSQTLMPLGDLGSKDETRQIARDLGLHLADKPDSQEICFVPPEGYTKFLADKAPAALSPGRIVDTSGKDRGEHTGIANYTIGQRKRLPAASTGALYVIKLDPVENTVVVGSDDDLYLTGFQVEDMHWLSIQQPDSAVDVSARIRYNATSQPARLFPVNAKEARCEFDEPQRAITPGQAAVFYDCDLVLGGGTISDVAQSSRTAERQLLSAITS
jgi:tRNA-specific 2-thiouridylase